MKRASISFYQLSNVCRDRQCGWSGGCWHMKQPKPFDNTNFGPMGKCTQGRCPIWAEWVKRGLVKEEE